MARRAFIIGGTGQIGRAVAARLLDDGWTVALGSRGFGSTPTALIDRGAEAVVMDRAKPGGLRQALGSGADLLLDTIGYDAGDAAQLIDVQNHVGQLATISSASVYCDQQGRTLDEARSTGFPELPVPITEEQPVVPAGPDTYSTRKVAMELVLFDGARVPATVIRPCAIHGPHSQHPREWWFVKRLLDGRKRIPLAYEGRSRFQTSATANIAALIAAIVERPVTGALNAVDPDAPSVAEIGQAIMATIGRDATLIGILDPSYPPRLGVSPWAVPRPFILSDAAARAIGYRPVANYAGTVPAACRWLVEQSPRDWRVKFPVLASYPWELFDYAAKDAWMEANTGPS
jgi:nucleoside-diphosphate-sugar epimerase